jgi:hypothetical protein
MARKIVLVLVLAAAAAGGVFAQTANQTPVESAGPKMSLSLDLAPTFIGFIVGESEKNGTGKSYFALSPVVEFAIGNYSLGARVDLVFGSVKTAGVSKSVTHFGLAAIGRWYPLAKLQKLYLGTELGFDTCSVQDVDDALYTGFTFAVRAGWKQMMGPVFLEPSLGYAVSKTASGVYTSSMPLTPHGWQPGLNFGFAL